MNIDQTARLSLRAVIAIAVMAAPAAAHNVAPQPVRELLRIQGYRAPAPAFVTDAHEVVLTVLGQPISFAATDWRSFVFAEGAPPTSTPAPVTLQGDRPMLHAITMARTDQQITILAERRPGATDVFVLTVDLCPPR
jgi:hypothetical protein